MEPLTKLRFFRDFTGINKALLTLALLILGFIAREKLAYRSWDRQYWGVSLCSQQKNTYTLLSGDLTLNDGQYLPLNENKMKFDGISPICESCEESYPSAYREGTNFLLPPNTLSLEWASLSERRFYQGTFTLPKARIDSLFAHYRAHPDTTWRFEREPHESDPVGGMPITVGGLLLEVKLAAEGRVSLNVLVPTADQQGHIEKELAHFQATSYQPTWRTEPTYEYYFYAKTPQAYLDTLASRIDTAGYYRERRFQPFSK